MGIGERQPSAKDAPRGEVKTIGHAHTCVCAISVTIGRTGAGGDFVGVGYVGEVVGL